MERRKWIDDSPITDSATDWMDPTGDGTQEKSYSAIMAYIRSRLNTLSNAVLFGTVEQWNAQTLLVAEAGVVYVYTDGGTYTDGEGVTHVCPTYKIGDGDAYLIDMPCVADDVRTLLETHKADSSAHITSAERVCWNNKVSARVSCENLIFEND